MHLSVGEEIVWQIRQCVEARQIRLCVEVISPAEADCSIPHPPRGSANTRRRDEAAPRRSLAATYETPSRSPSIITTIITVLKDHFFLVVMMKNNPRQVLGNGNGHSTLQKKNASTWAVSGKDNLWDFLSSPEAEMVVFDCPQSTGGGGAPIGVRVFAFVMVCQWCDRKPCHRRAKLRAELDHRRQNVGCVDDVRGVLREVADPSANGHP